MRTTFDTLKAWFKDGMRLIESGNQHQRHYVDASNPSALDFESRKKALLNDPEGLVLLAYGKNFTLAHSFSQFGETLYRPENKVICLLGLHDSAAPFEIDVKTTLDEVKTITPSFKAIWECESIDELKALEAPEKITRGTETDHQFECCSVLFMPPWAEEATLDFEPIDPTPEEDLSLALLLHLKEAAEAFNTAHENDKNPVDSLEYMKFASRFLWLLHQGTIDKADLIFAHNDPEAREFSTQRLKQCTNPPVTASTALGNPTGGPETFVQLTSEISKFAESNARSNALRVKELEKADEKKNRIGKWVNFSNKLMLLNMMSDDGITAATDFPEPLKQLINAESLGLMGRNFIWHLNQQGINNIHVSESALRQMYYGDIFSMNPGVIKGLSPFAFNESAEATANQTEELTMLHIADSTCTTKSLDDIKSAHHKDLIKVPSTYYELIEAFEAMKQCLKLYVGENTLPFIKFSAFVEEVKELKGQLNELTKNDPQIFAKVAYNQNLLFLQFCKECSICENREDVNEKFLDYSMITFDIKSSRFCVELPGQFRVFKPAFGPTPQVPTGPPNRNEDEDPREPKEKKRKIINSSQHAPFNLHENENFNKTFTGREKVKTCPHLNGKPMCRRWNILGHCYSTCNMKCNHVPENQIPEQLRSDFLGWMTTCRQVSGSA
jgi:hypothetical protein